jgi:vacuolar-type H+-ATPase subunit I/STV1
MNLNNKYKKRKYKMSEIRFEISTEDLIEELQDDCKELERELVKTKAKVKSLGELVQSYSSKFEYVNQIDNVEEIRELFESIGLMLQDNANTINGYLEQRANR